MLTAKATLIQDIGDFLKVVEPILRNYPELDNPAIKKRFLEWLFAKEISLCYLLYDERLIRSNESSRFTIVYNALNTELGFALSPMFTHFIKAPKLYGDTEIRISVHHMQLHIDYYRDVQSYPVYVI